MKSNDNTEMDRLMRRFGRRSGGVPRSGVEQSGDPREANNSVHLDADEMNAYAEGALPQGSRSRYFAHLADCDSCRKLVTDLTLAATRADAAEARVAAIETPPRKSWREWLGAIFSPPVLRYGVPAVALFAVIVVAIVATRTQRDASNVAQNAESGRAYAPFSVANSNSTAGPEQDRLADHKMASNNASPNVQIDERPQTTMPAATSPVQAAPTDEDSPKASVADAAKPAATPAGTIEGNREFGEIAKRAEQEVTVTQVRPPPPESGATADATNRDKQEAQKKAKVAGKDDDSTMRSKSVGGAIATESRANEARPMAGRRAAPSTQSQPMNRPAAPPKEAPADLAAGGANLSDTRSVGGRKFRREGGAWVDTAYRSSLATTNVARGSEQYRALVADEPGLRAVTQQLAGEVVVVWKSRAYRFY